MAKEEVLEMNGVVSEVLPDARYRVTLLEACPARVRVGEVTSLEFQPNATVPIPSEFRTRHWVQVDDCLALLRKRPPR